MYLLRESGRRLLHPVAVQADVGSMALHVRTLLSWGGGGGSRTEKKLPDTCMITLQYIRYIHTDPRACETCGIWVQWVQRIFYYGSCRTCMYIHSTPLPLPRYIDGLCRFDHTRWTHPRKEEGGEERKKKRPSSDI